MSKEYYFEKYYKDVDFTDDEAKTLKSQFLEFSPLWNLSIVFIKRNFKRVFLSPALWQLLMGFVAAGIIILFSLNTILNTNPEVFRSVADDVRNQSTMMSDKKMNDIGPRDSFGYQDQSMNQRRMSQPELGKSILDSNQGSEEIGKLALSLLGAFLVYLLFVFVLSIVYSLMYLRQIYIANSKSVESIWKTPRGFYIDLLKLVAILIIYGIGSSILAGIIGAISEPLGTISSLVIQIAAYGFYGICVYLLVIEKEGLMESLQLSFKLMKPVFWKNVGRWALFMLVMLGVGIGIGITFVIIGFILFFIGMSLKGAVLIGFIILSALVFIVLAFGVSVIVNSLSFAFNYISFVNIRMYAGNVMLESREDETGEESSEADQKTETKVEKLESKEIEEVVVVEEVQHTKKAHKEHKVDEGK